MSNPLNVKPLPRKPIHKAGKTTPLDEVELVDVSPESQNDEESQNSQFELDQDVTGNYEIYTDTAGSDYDYENGESRHRSLSRDPFEISRSCPRTPPRPKQPKYRSTTPAAARSFRNKSFSSSISSSSRSESLVDPKTNSSLFSMFMIAILLVVFAGALAFFIDYRMKTVPAPMKNCSYVPLAKSYPHQDHKVWNILRVGIEMILNKRVEDPAVYLFVHHGGSRIDKLVKEIALHTSSCFDDKKQPIEMVHEDFTSAEAKEDYGRAIEKFRKKIAKGNVILIANLNEIPPEAARAFHTICDTHSPIAKDLVIFLTLIIPENKEGNANVDTLTEDTLFQLWGKSLPRNELDPLITRVTDQVIALKN